MNSSRSPASATSSRVAARPCIWGLPPVALFNVDGQYFAIHNSCPHEDGPLGEGTLCGCVVTCPVHAYEFDVTSGECLTESAYRVEQFEVRVEGEDILVRL